MGRITQKKRKGERKLSKKTGRNERVGRESTEEKREDKRKIDVGEKKKHKKEKREKKTTVSVR